MSNFVNKLNRMEHTYQVNIEEIGEVLHKIGISVCDDYGCYKPFLEILTDIKQIWDKLPDDENSNITKSYIAQSIVGIRDKNILISVLEL